MLKFVLKYKYYFILALLFLLLRLPSLFEPYWYGDEGIYLTLGQAIRRGLHLYSQVHDNKPPTLYYLASIFPTLFGFRFLLLLFMIPTIYFFKKLSLVFLKEKAARLALLLFVIFSSIPLFEGNIANAENFMLLPTIAGFLIFLKAKKNIHYFIAAFLLGIAFTIKIPVFIEFVFLFIWLFLINFNSLKKNFKKNFWPLFITLFIFGIGFLLPTILWGLYYAKLGILPQFLSSALLQNFSYLSSWATGTQTASASSGGLMVRLLFLVIFWIATYVFYIRKKISTQSTFLLFWLGATLFGVLLPTRPYPHYIIQSIPPLVLIIFLIIYKKGLSQKIINGLVLVLFVITIFSYKFYLYPTLKYYKNFYSIQSPASYNSYFGNHVITSQQIAGHIKENTQDSDYIFLWGDQSYIYAMANRLPPGRYTVAYHIVDFDGYAETMVAIKTYLPKYIVYSHMSDRPFPQLDEFISKYYFLEKTFDSNLIFKLR
jgi:hypothetical protein